MPVMVVVPELANAYGLHEALVLRQLHYWLQRATCHHDGAPWVYKSISEWAEEFTWWQRSTVHRLLNKLAEEELITIRSADGRTYYTINYYALHSDCRDSLVMLSENRTDGRPEEVSQPSEPSEIQTIPSENRTEVSENRTVHYKEVTESTTETTPQKAEEIAASAAPPATPSASKPKPRRSRKSGSPPNTSEVSPLREPTEWQEFVGAFCWLCHGHKEVKTLTKEKRGALLSEAKVVHEEYSVEDLREWYKRVWGKSWQYKRDNTARPLPSDVRSTIAQLRADTPEGFDIPANGYHANGNSKVAGSLAALDQYDEIKFRHGVTT